MTAPKLTFYLDVVSPFSYLAFHLLRTSRVFAPCEISYVPISLLGIMKASGNMGPFAVKSKAKWANLDRLRWAKAFDIPISESTPDPFPQSTLNAQRALAALEAVAPEKVPVALEALYQAFWVEGTSPIGDEKVFGPILKGVLGEELGAKVCELAVGEEAKERLQSSTDAIVEEGAFGAPWFVAENGKGERQMFWGFDHLGQVVEFLGLEREGAERGFRSFL
ncbi:HCCA isomerase/glutathione S-transferase kappa [Polychaeton citri CBS 116435]|uniref:Glutathione S-transferase kappa n=1 Tax=Polychaeton citri CBS 116435 TaxID=1314669 RepID=A0A9P4URI1_9PEZI|nr:HCCA isomerase/glutathione S-transferase kappa [Polychaeton citri CBS 116435]